MKLASRVLLTIPILGGLVGVAQAQISFSGTVFQNFDSPTLATTGTGVAWTNNSTIAGWSLFHVTSNSDPTPVAITTYDAGTGSSAIGSFYSFGLSSPAPTFTERALGGIGVGSAYFGSPNSGAVAGWIAVNLQNTSGKTLDQFTISYTGEQWRNGANATTPQSMVLEYGYGSSFSGVTTWNAAGAGLTFTSLQNSATATSLNGNSAANRTRLTGTVTGQTWTNNQQLWVRWIENNDAGFDHGLAVDEFQFSSSAILPEPGTFALAGLGLVGLALRRRRK